MTFGALRTPSSAVGVTKLIHGGDVMVYSVLASCGTKPVTFWRLSAVPAPYIFLGAGKKLETNIDFAWLLCVIRVPFVTLGGGGK